MFKKLSFIFSLFFPLRDFLYILQLEDYQSKLYVKHIPQRLFRRGFEVRGALKFTFRAKLISLVALILWISILLLFNFVSTVACVIVFVLTPLLVPCLVLLSNLLVIPFSDFMKRRTIKRTKTRFRKSHPNTKIIALTGSYSKTTTKYLLLALLEHSFETVVVPDNINTALGIAEYLQKENISTNTEYLIVEMGADRRGGIKDSAEMLSPDIALLTALGDQHLDKFGGFAGLVREKFEIFSNSASEAKKYASDSVVNTLQQHDLPADDVVKVPKADSNTEFLAIAVAKELGVEQRFIDHALSNFELPNRRNSQYESNGVTIIDNSYNISLQTAEYTLNKASIAAQKLNKSLVVVTGGIPERDSEVKLVHKEFAEIISNKAKRVILLPTCYKDYISKHLSIPVVETPRLLTVLEKPQEFADPKSEILLIFPELTDLSY